MGKWCFWRYARGSLSDLGREQDLDAFLDTAEEFRHVSSAILNFALSRGICSNVVRVRLIVARRRARCPPLAVLVYCRL